MKTIIKKLFIIIISLLSLFSCKKREQLNLENFRHGTFEILEDEKYDKTTFKRIGDLQIEYFEERIDTLSIHWKNNFSYTLQMLHPKSKLDNEPINIMMKSVTADSYDFEAIIGHSNFVIKGTVVKISDN